ncbi:helix-turn-helix domain-containing protein [Priestia taiwanensis]|uniref:XRE family transcriptional regulator n=1 Tax=Priestia taiwanensis TaxID=1347902 RepID=A0A917ETR3_9BACI|nr:helix-turn-helix domain-containing protein [Priestia taiwanensis]MBM7364793.1 desulfoferrodoxin (superoxide reductase-like protein)/DNA-binding XRE family transcriptional regulator [Priestia taiwanensis]GGE79693.1 XRE family transcriptional regulator [Priestia taiwanensis]
MNCIKVGRLIQSLRKDKRMTQKELALLMNISDKTISKWERGLGCPDVSLLGELSNILGVNIEMILSGDLNPNEQDEGNMKNVKFYACQSCGNIMTSTGASSISCCGRILESLLSKTENDEHKITVHEIEEDYFVTIKHEMSRDHYISFVAYISYDRVMLIKLYPEQLAEVRFPKMHGGTLYMYCNRHGLWKYEKKKLGLGRVT